MTQGAFYKLSNLLHGLPTNLRHGDAYVADGEPQADTDMSRLELDAHVRSGDYLSTLATTLDELSARQAAGEHISRSEIDRIVNDLLYVGSRYTIVRK